MNLKIKELNELKLCSPKSLGANEKKPIVQMNTVYTSPIILPIQHSSEDEFCRQFSQMNVV